MGWGGGGCRGGGGCWGGGGWGGCYGMGMGCGGGYGMGMGCGGGYGMGMGYGRGWGGGYGGYSMGGYAPMMSGYAYSPTISSWGMGTPIASAGGMSQSYYSSPNTGNEATLVVHVPGAASVSIDGQPTQQSSSTRFFTSPPLEQGKTYVYKVTAEMNRDGHTVRDTKNVEVRPGQRTEVTMNFGSSNSGREERSEPNEDETRPRTTPRSSPRQPPDR
jgi:uncharacterized protein (TIGR03000 family)